jgi:hypothetical protein
MTNIKKQGLWSGLWERTKEVAATYTGTFIVVMILNQIVFFGFCLNPICLIAAMPHVLLITVFVGTIINKIGNWGEKGLVKKGASIASNKLENVGDALIKASEEFKENTEELRRAEAARSQRQAKMLQELDELIAASDYSEEDIAKAQAQLDLEQKTNTEVVSDSNTPQKESAENKIPLDISSSQGHQKVYITKSRLSNIVYSLDKGDVSKTSYDELYKTNLKQIYSQKELALLSVYKEMCRDSKQALQSYKKVLKKGNHNKYVFEDGTPAYHADIDCSLLHGDYYNLEIPVEIKHRGEREVARFKEFCKTNRDLIIREDPIVLKKLDAQFVLKNPPTKISAQNSGSEEFVNMNLTELEFQIGELLSEAEVFRNKDQDTFKTIQNLGYGSHVAKEAKVPDSPLYIWHNTYKVPIKELLMHYFRVRFNPDLGFDGQLLDQLGFKPCSKCS